MKTGVNLFNQNKGQLTYQFEHLNFTENANGNRHVLHGNFRLKKWNIYSNSSTLSSSSNVNESTFLRTYNRIIYSMTKAWIGSRFEAEDNEQKNKITNELTPLSQRFTSLELFTGYGDSTNVFIETGYKLRSNDSIRNNRIEKVNSSNTFYINSQLIKM